MSTKTSLQIRLYAAGIWLFATIAPAFAQDITLALRTPVDSSQQRFGNGSRIGFRALPPPENRETLDSCAEEEATAA